MLIPFDQLFRRHNVRAKNCLHLGANTGQEAEAYAANGVERVIWVEALPTLYDQLVRNLLQYPKALALKACVSDQDGETVQFHIANNGGQSSSFLDFGTHSKEHPTVKFVRDITLTTIRVDTLLHEHGVALFRKDGPWFLNIDLQGAELKALVGMGELLAEFDYAYIEVNEKELYVGCPRVSEIDTYLAEFGLVGKEVKMTGSGWGDKFYSR